MAETFGDLDPRIDAREGDVPAKEWGGYHLIEKALWKDGSLSTITPQVTADLNTNVQTLENLVQDVDLQPAAIANGAVELLNEVSKSKITGEEERYSRVDLVDFEANVQGAEAAYDAVKPILEKKNPKLATELDAKFAAVYAALAPYKTGTTATCVHRPDDGRHQEAVAGDRHARRAALEGVEAGRPVVTRAGPDPRSVSRRAVPRHGRRRGRARRGRRHRRTARSSRRPRAGAAVRPAARRRSCRSRASHQAGIVTPVQDRLLFASFDVITDDRDELVRAARGVDERRRVA